MFKYKKSSGYTEIKESNDESDKLAEQPSQPSKVNQILNYIQTLFGGKPPASVEPIIEITQATQIFKK